MEKRSEKSHINELNLLLYCARTKIDLELKSKVEFIVKQGIDWNYVFDLSYAHAVVPLVYNSLKQIDLGLPPESLDKFSSYFLRNAFRSLTYSKELVKIATTSQKNDIKLLPFKGSIFAASIYGNLALRTFGDIDFLIKEEKLSATLHILQELEYPPAKQIAQAEVRPYLKYPRFHESLNYQKSLDIIDRQRDIALELHWELFNSSFSFPVSFEQLWQRRIYVEIKEAMIPTFCYEDLIIYLCTHASKHGWFRLQWICDVAELIRATPQLNWSQVYGRAADWGCLRMLSLGLTLAHDLLDAPLPQDIQQRLQGERQAQRLAQQVKSRLADVEASFNIYLFILKCRERARDRLRFILCLIFVPKQEDWNFFPLPSSIHFLYYLIRPVRLLIKPILRSRTQ
ncbi:MAG: nucleotidyltransferase family protein [Cyanobacteria bacterium J06629_2]